MDPATLVVLQMPGSYSGRRVPYFRAFDAVRAAEAAVQVRVFDDLDTHQELVLGSGHVEQNGAVALVTSEAARPARRQPERRPTGPATATTSGSCSPVVGHKR
jgi:hypothetical protein